MIKTHFVSVLIIGVPRVKLVCYGGSVDQNVGVIERCNRESREVLDQAREVAQPGSATVWGTGGRVFESRLPDKITASAVFLLR